jgi:phosphate transport system substrate-binding protein
MKILRMMRLFVIVGIGIVHWVSIAVAENITIVGTGSGAPLLRELGKVFTQRYPDIIVHVPKSIGSSGGIRAVGRDEYLLGRVAREIRGNELSYGLSYLPFAKVPIVFFVHRDVDVRNLSTQQILEIYSGKLTNWNELGGKDLKIRVIRREKTDSSLSVLNELFPGFEDMTVAPRSKITYTDPETVATVEKISGSIVYGPYPNARNAQVNILMIDHKDVTDTSYPYYSPIALIFKEKNYTGSIKKFVEFVTSEAAHEVIRKAGGIPFNFGN